MPIYAVVVKQDCDEALAALIHEYLRDHSQPFLASRSFQQDGSFVWLELMKSMGGDESLKVAVPAQFALYAVELEPGRQNTFGFVP